MNLFPISMTSLLLFTQSHNGLKNVKKRKSVKSTIQQPACQQKPFHSTSLPTIWICVRSLMSTLLQQSTSTKVYPSLFSYAVNYLKLFMNGRKRTSKPHVTSLSFVTTPSTKVSSLSTTSVPLPMTEKKSAQTNVKVV